MAEEPRILYEDPYLVVCVKPAGGKARLYRHGASTGQDRGRSDGIVPATGGHGQADDGHSRS